MDLWLRDSVGCSVAHQVLDSDDTDGIGNGVAVQSSKCHLGFVNIWICGHRISESQNYMTLDSSDDATRVLRRLSP